MNTFKIPDTDLQTAFQTASTNFHCHWEWTKGNFFTNLPAMIIITKNSFCYFDMYLILIFLFLILSKVEGFVLFC